MNKEDFVVCCLKKYPFLSSNFLTDLWDLLGRLHRSLFNEYENKVASRKQLNFQIAWYSALRQQLQTLHENFYPQTQQNDFAKAFHFAANIIYAHFSTNHQTVETSVYSLPVPSTSTNSTFVQKDELTDSLLLLGGGTLALVRQQLLKKASKAKKSGNIEVFAQTNRLLTLLTAFIMSFKGTGQFLKLTC